MGFVAVRGVSFCLFAFDDLDTANQLDGPIVPACRHAVVRVGHRRGGNTGHARLLLAREDILRLVVGPQSFDTSGEAAAAACPEREDDDHVVLPVHWKNGWQRPAAALSATSWRSQRGWPLILDGLESALVWRQSCRRRPVVRNAMLDLVIRLSTLFSKS